MPVRVAAVLLALLLFPAAASAEIRTGTLSDPADADASADLAGVDVSYDTTGEVTATVRFTAAPTATDALVSVTVGDPRADGTCGLGFLIGSFPAGTTDAAWSTVDANGDATRAQDGATLTLSASDYRLGGDFSCVSARITKSGTTLDDTTRATLAGAPEPTPTASPSPTPSPTPAPQGTKPTATPLERYDAALRACAAKPKKQRAACRRTAVKRNRAGARLAAKRRTNPLIGNVFLQFQVDVAGLCGGACLEYLGFPDDKRVSTNLPEDGPALDRCAKQCTTYRLKGRRLTVGKTTYTVSRNGRTLKEGKDGVPYTRVVVPRAGLRIGVALHSISSFGIPGVNQVFNSSDLTLSRDGRFVIASATSGTSGGGTDFETNYTVLPADRRGTYAFEPGGSLALRFENGYVRRDSATVAFGGDGRLGDPVKDGLFLDGTFFQAPD